MKDQGEYMWLVLIWLGACYKAACYKAALGQGSRSLLLILSTLGHQDCFLYGSFFSLYFPLSGIDIISIILQTALM